MAYESIKICDVCGDRSAPSIIPPHAYRLPRERASDPLIGWASVTCSRDVLLAPEEIAAERAKLAKEMGGFDVVTPEGLMGRVQPIPDAPEAVHRDDAFDVCPACIGGVLETLKPKRH